MDRRVLKRLIRPFARPIVVQMDARVAPVEGDLRRTHEKLEGIERTLKRLQAHLEGHARQMKDHNVALESMKEQVDGVNHHLPLLLNTISSQNAVTRQARRAEERFQEEMESLMARLGSIDARVATMDERYDRASIEPRLTATCRNLEQRIDVLEKRGETVRREMLFELRYGGVSKGMSTVPEPRIIDQDKVRSSEGDLRVNLGCGHLPRDEYVNVDGRALDGVDVVADVRELPFEPGTVAEMFAAHLLEHFPIEELRRKLLPHWLELLRPGGVVVVVVPDAETMIREYAVDRLSFEDLRLVTFGEQEYEGDFHFTMFSKTSVCSLLSETGFTEVAVVESGRRNGACYEMEITARRPRDD